MPEKLNTEKFIIKAKTFHKEKYNYSKTIYKNTRTKVLIICEEHGVFKQLPYNHLRGQGCAKCANNYNYSNNYFIEKAKNIHGDKYDYSKVKYINNNQKVIIICKKHGNFLQKPSGHLLGYGCIKCYNFKQLKIHDLNTFIEKANVIFDNMYDYSKVNYIDLNTKINIICKIHGEFEKTPNYHLKGYGCNKCLNICKFITNKNLIDLYI